MLAFAGLALLAFALTGMALLLLLGPAHPFWPRIQSVLADVGKPLAVIVATGAACLFFFGLAVFPPGVTAGLVFVEVLAILAIFLLRRP